jgi:hypothetical protein
MSARRGTSGIGLVEVLLSVAFLGIVLANVALVLRSSSESGAADLSADVLDEQARTVLRRIALSLMSASRDSLSPDASSGLDSSHIRYRSQIGFEDGEVLWDDPQQIRLAEPSPQLLWSENPDTPDERRVVWSNLVAPLLEGELMNGLDDNHNGLIDEKGLSFAIDRDAVAVRLTIERRDAHGRARDATVETTVTCRNPPVEPVEP